GREYPGGTQPRDGGRRDLRERTESPAVIGAADHQPIVVFRILQALSSDRPVVAEHRWHRRGDWRRTTLRGHCRKRGADNECRECNGRPWCLVLGPWSVLGA